MEDSDGLSKLVSDAKLGQNLITEALFADRSLPGLGFSVNQGPWQDSPVIFKLLQGKDVLIEVLLELLVGIVNVELLEPVHLERENL